MATVVPSIEDALRTVSWPEHAHLGDAVLMIRKLDLGVLSHRPSRQIICALIASRLADMPLVWSAYESDCADVPLMVWPSKAASIAHAALVLDRLGSNTQSAPWWVARVLGDASVNNGEVSAAVARAVHAQVKHVGEAVIVAVSEIICANGRPDLAARVLLKVLDRIEAAKPLPALSKLTTTKDAQTHRGVPSHSSIEVPAARRLLERLAACLSLPARRVWDAIVQVEVVHILPLQQRIETLYKLGRAATPPLSQHAFDRRFEALVVDAIDARAQLSSGRITNVAVINHMHRPLPAQNNQRAGMAAAPDSMSAQSTKPHERPTKPHDHGEVQQTIAGGVVGLINLIAAAGLPEMDEVYGTELALAVLQAFLARLPDGEGLQAAFPMPLSDVHPAAGWTCPNVLLAPTPAALRARRRGLLFGDGQKKVAVSDPYQALQAGLMVLLSRQARVMTGFGWRSLLTRPALFTASPTHLDVILNLDEVRIAERRMGLDLSPGWVPWLGRIVTLHFERFTPPTRLSEGQYER
ncbi:MAG: hypothetical protein AAGF56_02210 [Pseudomonadota bacterium]